MYADARDFDIRMQPLSTMQTYHKYHTAIGYRVCRYIASLLDELKT
jgi:hypothetical protein